MIVSLKRVFILGTQKEKEKLLEKLQELGVLHIEPVIEKSTFPLEEDIKATFKSIEILKNYSPNSEKVELLPKEIVENVAKLDLELKRNLDEKEVLLNQLDKIKLWGNFSTDIFNKLSEDGVNLKMYKCLLKDKLNIKANIIWDKIVGNEYLFVIYSDVEEKIPAVQEIKPEKGTVEINNELEEIDKKISLTKQKLNSYSNCISELEKYITSLLDKADFIQAKDTLLNKEEIFCLQGWIPFDLEENLKESTKEIPVVIEVREANEKENPPTLIRNPKWIQSILDVVKLYATPGYSEWDPSSSVYLAFTVFFAMIVGDGGYGAIILALMLAFKKKLMASDAGARVFRLMVTLSIGCIIFGLLSGTWFAINVFKNPIINTNDTSLMMNISLMVGAVHLTCARLIQIARLGRTTLVLPEIGWILIIWSGISFFLYGVESAMNIILVGAALIFLFSSTSFNPFVRIAKGIAGLVGITQNFADVLSYLRLFALGLASAMMGQIFNEMGLSMKDAVPVIGPVLMILIIFFGHTINLVLAIMGGFIHGLRLNFLEFYRYCFEGTGKDYNPFFKRGV